MSANWNFPLHVCFSHSPLLLPQPSGAPWSLVTSVLCSKEESMSCFLSWNKQRSRSTTRLLLSTLITVLWQHNTANLRSLRYCTHTHESGSVSLCLLISSTNVFLIVNSGLELHKTKKGKYNPHSLPLPPALSWLLPLSLSLSHPPSLPRSSTKNASLFSVL